MHGLGPGTSLLESGWTLQETGVTLSERRVARVGILVSPQLAACTLGFFLRRGFVYCTFSGGMSPDCYLRICVMLKQKNSSVVGVRRGERLSDFLAEILANSEAGGESSTLTALCIVKVERC